MYFSALKLLSIFITLLLIKSLCFGYDFDRETLRCLEQAGSSYAGMYNCTYQDKVRHYSQSQSLIQVLKNVKTPYEKNIILHNQNLLEIYIKSLNMGEIKILNDTMGIMYQTLAQNTLANIYLTNSQILEILYTGNMPKRDISDGKFSMDKLENEVNKNLKALDSNLTKEQYNKILQSQKDWNIYRNDVEVNLLPLINNKPELKIYIKRLILENRINTLYDLNQIKD